MATECTAGLDQPAIEAALAKKGLTVLGHQEDGALIVCRGLDSCQNDVYSLDISHCWLQECCILEVCGSLVFHSLPSNVCMCFLISQHDLGLYTVSHPLSSNVHSANKHMLTQHTPILLLFTRESPNCSSSTSAVTSCSLSTLPTLHHCYPSQSCWHHVMSYQIFRD